MCTHSSDGETVTIKLGGNLLGDEIVLGLETALEAIGFLLGMVVVSLVVRLVVRVGLLVAREVVEVRLHVIVRLLSAAVPPHIRAGDSSRSTSSRSTSKSSGATGTHSACSCVRLPRRQHGPRTEAAGAGGMDDE